MAIKPILFNTPMVQAILDGRKTITRRLLKPRYRDDECGFQVVTNAQTGEFVRVEKLSDQGSGQFPDGSERHVHPPYRPGDILYVRETWQYAYDTDSNENIDYESGRYLYAADNIEPFNGWIMPDGTERDSMPWRPSIHMPKAAARIFLRVTDVRVERLQDIDGEQAYSEGATADIPGILEQLETHGKPKFPKNFEKFSEAQKEDWYKSQATATYIAQMELANRLILSFKEIWDSTIKKEDLPTYGWDANPWVWAYRFERCANPFVEKEET